MRRARDIVIYDNLSYGHDWGLLSGRLVKGDLGDKEYLDAVIAEEKFDAVIHMAAFIVVDESIHEPLKYYHNNFINTLTLIGACLKHGVKKFLFSSTEGRGSAGIPEKIPVTEETPLLPINPYGASKVMVEQALKDISASDDLRYVALRYFNVAG